MFGGIAKWVYEIDRPERIPELVARAFATALAGRPGPVVLSLPEDVLSATGEAADALPVRRVAAAPAQPISSACARCCHGRTPARDRRRQRLGRPSRPPTSARS